MQEFSSMPFADSLEDLFAQADAIMADPIYQDPPTRMPRKIQALRMPGRQYPSARMIRLTCLWAPVFHLPVTR